ncbi:hypothetical protein LINGRAHAP2_LOCUS11446 [Linum grandiflorum]
MQSFLPQSLLGPVVRIRPRGQLGSRSNYQYRRR